MANSGEGNRREFLIRTAAALIGGRLVALGRVEAARRGLPSNNPTSKLKLAWTEKLPWDRVIDITTVPGKNWHEKLEAAQAALEAYGGGVVYFPPGVYRFSDSLHIRSGIILRGADPQGTNDAREDRYHLPTRFEFPAYKPRFEDGGTDNNTAFKGIYVTDPVSASNCGVVNIFINRGHIRLDEAEEHRVGSNRLVYGCILQNAAVCDPRVPDLSVGQRPWQRYTHRHFAAIDVKSYQNVLVANNRLIPSTDSFLIRGYVLRGRGSRAALLELDVEFDFDNRPGIEVNHFCIGAPGGEEPSGTPESHPWGFRTGIVIWGNYVYSTGRTAIAFSGDGVICSYNVVRFKKDVWRPTHDGIHQSTGASTNDNRAVEMRGYRWVLEGNDYEVYRNWAADRKYYINDGEGLMHENHCNSAIIESAIINNRGNAYLSLYKTGCIDGLHIEGNNIQVPERMNNGVNRAIAIMVDADHSPDRRGPCRNVVIAQNKTIGGILLGGHPSCGNVIRGNRNLKGKALIVLRAQAALEDNSGYDVVRST